MNIVTPDQIVRELRHLNELADNLPNDIAHAEARLNAAEDIFQEAWDDAYLEATGTVAEREIRARVATRNLKPVVDEERRELSRLKALSRRLESEQSNLQSQFKAIQITYGGHGG